MEFATDQKELVAGCLSADSTAWETMIRRHGPGIGRLAHRYASLRGEVEDIKQEVFLKVFCKLNTFRVEEGNLGSWITRIGRNLIFDRLRRKNPILSTLEREDLESLAGGDGRVPDPESAAIMNEASKKLRRSMRRLPGEIAETVVLRYLGEMTYDEIAEVLQVPCGTVKSRLKHGRDQLYRKFNRSADFANQNS